MLELYRRGLALRRAQPALGDGSLRWLEAPEGALAFARDPGFQCLVNLASDPVALRLEGEILLASGPLTDDGLLPGDTAVWLSI
jgi:alpha-glucosidase